MEDAPNSTNLAANEQQGCLAPLVKLTSTISQPISLNFVDIHVPCAQDCLLVATTVDVTEYLNPHHHSAMTFNELSSTALSDQRWVLANNGSLISKPKTSSMAPNIKYRGLKFIPLLTRSNKLRVKNLTPPQIRKYWYKILLPSWKVV